MSKPTTTYLPDLGRCLSGEVGIVSWEEVLDCLLSHDDRQYDTIQPFFVDQNVKTLFSSPLPFFPNPTSAAKSAFDTRTASINITPSDSQPFNIEEIKSDALWLSAELDIDQLESLRVVALEWRLRPQLRLKEGFSDAELASLRDALGSDYVSAHGLVQGESLQRSDDVFNSENARKARLASLCLSEDAALLDVFAELFQESLSKEGGRGPTSSNILHFISELNSPSKRASALTDLMISHIQQLEKCIDKLEQPPPWSFSDEFRVRVQDVCVTSTLRKTATILELLLIRVRENTSSITSDAVLSWLQFAEKTGYFTTFNSDNAIQQALICRIQSASSLVTLAIIDPASVLSSLPDSDNQDAQPRIGNGDVDYLTDIHNIAEINEKMVLAADACNVQASPAFFAWAIILQELKLTASAIKETRESHHVQRAIDGVVNYDSAGRRASFGSTTSSTQASIYEEVLDKISSSSPIEEPAIYLSRCGIEVCNVFAQLALINSFKRRGSSTFIATRYTVLQELVAMSLPLMGYSADLIAVQLALLTVPPLSEQSFSTSFDPTTIFLADSQLLDGFFETAAARFPYETLPFLRFCKSLAKAQLFDDHGVQYVAFRLKQLESFTHAAVHGFAAYQTIREDENANLVSLQDSVSILDSMSSRLIGYGKQSNNIEVIPANTIGEVISENTPAIIRWQHQYSGLSLLGKFLDTYLSGLLGGIVSRFESQDEIIVEVLEIFTHLISTTLTRKDSNVKREERQQQCRAMIDEASSTLDADTDVIQLTFLLLERELQSFRQRSSTFTCNLSVACIDLITAFAKVDPRTTISGLLKSSLLSTHTTADLFPSIVSVIELPTGDFPFLAACSRLYSGLPSILLNGLVKTDKVADRRPSRQARPAKAQIPFNVSIGRNQAAMLLTYTEMMFGLFDVSADWSFNLIEQRSEIVTGIVDTFGLILRLAYGIGEQFGASTSVTNIYLPAANSLIGLLRPEGGTIGQSGPILRHLVPATLSTPSDSVAKSAYMSQTKSLSALACDTVRCGMLMNTTNLLDREMLNAFPILLRSMLWTGAEMRWPLQLFISILVATDDAAQSSLLGHLGSESCLGLVKVIEDLQHDRVSAPEQVMVWKILSALVTPKQQWLAMVVLTGQPPAGSRRDKSDNSKRQTGSGKPIFKTALDVLSDIDNLDDQVSVAMLEFVVQSLRNWSWALDSLKSHREFCQSLINYISNGKHGRTSDKETASHNQIAALFTELATYHLHYAKATRDLATLKMYIPLLNWLTVHAVEVSSYNTSLHSNLRKNFSMKFGGLNVMTFKRTGLVEGGSGDGFFFDMDVMNMLFADEKSWDNGKDNQQSFAAETRRADENLSLVESELVLLQQLRHLCVDHCGFLVQDREVQKSMAHIVTRCLIANTRMYPSEVIFEAVFQTRADLALALIRQLVVSQIKGTDVMGLLVPAWDATRFRCGNYEMAIVNADLPYWRSILSILLLSLQFHTLRKSKPLSKSTSSLSISHFEPFNDIVLEIIRVVVGDGLKSIVAAIHEQHYSQGKSEKTTSASVVDVKDVAITLSFLQTVLQLPTLSQVSTQLSEILIGSNLIRSCLQLYSWSHILTAATEPSMPIYAGISLQYLIILTSLPLVAEEAAVEGVLSRLLTFRMTQNLQAVPNGTSFGDRRPMASVYYDLWAEGMLPLCLNLLHSVGGAVASEVSAFLYQFPQQLKMASEVFAPTPNQRSSASITLATAREAASLALLSNILASFRDAGASAAVDPTTIMPLNGYDEHKKSLGEDIRDILQEPQAERKKRIVASNEKEVSWQRSAEGDLLEKKISSQLENALACLRGADEDEK